MIKLQKLKSLDYSQNQVVAENEQGEKENFDLVVLVKNQIFLIKKKHFISDDSAATNHARHFVHSADREKSTRNN